MLFFPIFTVGSIILDSVVGERERKTVESMLVTPLSRRDIVVSKFLAISIFVLVQLIIWLGVFKVYGIPVQNELRIFLFILIIDSAIISTALLLAYYSQTVKEANVLIMFLYTVFFIGLIVSLSIRYFDILTFSTPFTVISDLVNGMETSLKAWSAVLLAYTFIILFSNISMIERDDIVFGPRPGVFDLLADLSLWLFNFGKPGYLFLSIVFGFFAIIYSTMVEMAAGIFLFFSIGFTTLIVPLFALIEETIKPFGVYLLASKKELSTREGVLLGVLSGIVFFALESIIFALATYYLFPERLLSILELRISTTLIVHSITSGLVGYGIVKKDSYLLFLLIAVFIHSTFNLLVTGVVI